MSVKQVRHTSGSGRVLVRWLLLFGLMAGIVAMHALGHAHTGGATPASPGVSSAAALPVAAAHAGGHTGHRPAADVDSSSQSPHQSLQPSSDLSDLSDHSAHLERTDHRPQPMAGRAQGTFRQLTSAVSARAFAVAPVLVLGMSGPAGTDPTSVCLAVLGAVVLLPALGGALNRRRRDHTPAIALGIPWPSAASGLSPPRPPGLPALSVFRL